jgi:hypothetical protein
MPSRSARRSRWCPRTVDGSTPGSRFFAGEVEPCINGRTVAIGVYLGVDVDSIVARLLGEQLADGGWNCETENGPRHLTDRRHR